MAVGVGIGGVDVLVGNGEHHGDTDAESLVEIEKDPMHRLSAPGIPPATKHRVRRLVSAAVVVTCCSFCETWMTRVVGDTKLLVVVVVATKYILLVVLEVRRSFHCVFFRTTSPSPK